MKIKKIEKKLSLNSVTIIDLSRLHAGTAPPATPGYVTCYGDACTATCITKFAATCNDPCMV